jgi:hypothetical protein
MAHGFAAAVTNEVTQMFRTGGDLPPLRSVCRRYFRAVPAGRRYDGPADAMVESASARLPAVFVTVGIPYRIEGRNLLPARPSIIIAGYRSYRWIAPACKPRSGKHNKNKARPDAFIGHGHTLL